jgi:hypothetical protein
MNILFFYFVRDCLQEITPNKLQRVLKILENVSEAQMMVSKTKYFKK